MSSLQQVLSGRVWVFGDSVDTNQLAPSGLAGATMREAMRAHCLKGLRPDFNTGVRPGDIVVAGENFGCGSSRQSAVEALQVCGVAAVLAESLARIFRRNSIALGLPAFAVPGVLDLVDEGATVDVDYPSLTVRSADRSLPLRPLPPTVEAVYEAGGMFQLIKARLAERGITPASV